MSEQPTKSSTIAITQRTARAIAAILGQTSTDEAMRELNQSDGRSQWEQASFLAARSPYLREIYERGGTVMDGVLTVPRENLSLAPEIEITATHTAVEKLTQLTGDSEKAKELAPQLVAHGNRIAGSHSDGETRLKVFGWLYRTLEGKQELLKVDSTQMSEHESKEYSESQFSEKWQQIVELSETLGALEPKDSLPENSLEEFSVSDRDSPGPEIDDGDENLTEVQFYENEIDRGVSGPAEESFSPTGLIGFERIETSSDLPKIPETLSAGDFEKLLEKAGAIDSQIEHGASLREILAPFQGYIELTRLDNELRLVEEEYVKVHFPQKDQEQEGNYRFVAGREDLRELAEDKLLLLELRTRQGKLAETIRNSFAYHETGEMSGPSISINNLPENQADISENQEPELTDDEKELQKFLVEEKHLSREIETLSESVQGRETVFRSLQDLSRDQIPAERQKELNQKVLTLELPLGSVLKEKYPELTPDQRNEKLSGKNTFEIKNPAEYLYVRETATKHFLTVREREIKNEYRKFESKNLEQSPDKKSAGKEFAEHQEKIGRLKSLQLVFAYKIAGSQRVIRAEPSERAVAGFDFVDQYIRYQLKQPETVMRRESTLYREYAKRLELAKTTQDVIREAYQIRRENHRAAGDWKNSDKEERAHIERPLSKKEMTLLFLEQPPPNYTAEMSYLKYNFAHYAAAKEKMTAALLEGKLEPSAEAQKLIESLETRLVRRDLNTRHKATKHFFESLKTPDQNLTIKNEFDHHAAYQNLLPHEKDWIYARAKGQKENLEYKIAFGRRVREEKNIESPIQTANEKTQNLRKDFTAGTLWHQAAILIAQKPVKDFPQIANTNEKLLQTVGFLIHNQTEDSNLRVGEWLEKQNSDELKTAAEILKTFARATRKIEDNRLTVTVNLATSEKVTLPHYKKLFAAYFPADYQKQTEFLVGKGEKFRLEQNRRDAQTAVLNEWEKELRAKIYSPDAPVKVFENEIRAASEIEMIKSAQTECRRAMEIQTAILLKTEENLKKDLAKSNLKISSDNIKRTVKHAFSPQTSENLTSRQRAVFKLAQDNIPISDFERFNESAARLEKGLVSINQSFERIAALTHENAQYEYLPEATEKNESLEKQYESLQKQSEAEITSVAAREDFSVQTAEALETSRTIAQTLTAEALEKARIESHRRTRIALEPNELIEAGQSAEIPPHALEFADALESVYQANLHQVSAVEIKEAMTLAEEKHENLTAFLKKEQESNILPFQKPVSLKIYERELARNEKSIAQAKISEMLETGKLSLSDLETKTASEIFSPKEREEIRLEAGERTRENLEPKELWTKRQNLSEKLQQAALGASDTLDRAHAIYHAKNSDPKEISRVFSALDADIVNLKIERKLEQNSRKFINFKTEFKHDLAQIFAGSQSLENPQLLTAMTKGLFLNALEKQNVQPEKLGLGSEKLSEISRTITFAMVDDKKSKKMIMSGQSAAIPVQESLSTKTKTDSKTPNLQVKLRQFEHTR